MHESWTKRSGQAGIYKPPGFGRLSLACAQPPAHEGSKEVEGCHLESSCSQWKIHGDGAHDILEGLVLVELAVAAVFHNLDGCLSSLHNPGQSLSSSQDMFGVTVVVL